MLLFINLKDAYKARKTEIFSRFRDCGLWVQVHYIPVYFQPYYQKLGYKKRICPNAKDFYEREISIPVHSGMSDEDTDFVIDTIFTVLEKIK